MSPAELLGSTAGENAHGYMVYHTDSDLEGIGWSFSNGQGNELVARFYNLNGQAYNSLLRVLCVAIKALAPRFVGRKLSSLYVSVHS